MNDLFSEGAYLHLAQRSVHERMRHDWCLGQIGGVNTVCCVENSAVSSSTACLGAPTTAVRLHCCCFVLIGPGHRLPSPTFCHSLLFFPSVLVVSSSYDKYIPPGLQSCPLFVFRSLCLLVESVHFIQHHHQQSSLFSLSATSTMQLGVLLYYYSSLLTAELSAVAPASTFACWGNQHGGDPID